MAASNRNGSPSGSPIGNYAAFFQPGNTEFGGAVVSMPLPFVPWMVKLEDLNADGFLNLDLPAVSLSNSSGDILPPGSLFDSSRNIYAVTKTTTQSIIELLDGKKNGIYRRSNIKTRYSMLCLDGEIFAIYPEAIGRGAFGKVQGLYNIRTNTWQLVLKKQLLGKAEDLTDPHTLARAKATAEQEQETLNQLGKSPKTRMPLRSSTKQEVQYLQHVMPITFEKGVELENWLVAELREQPSDNEQEERNLDECSIVVPSLSPLRRVQIARAIAEALKRIHEEQNKLHRDVKAGNVMVDFIESVAEFIDVATMVPVDAEGVAVSEDKNVVGTFHHLTPELRAQLMLEPEARNLRYSKGSDVYAFTILLAHFFGLLELQAIPTNQDLADLAYYAGESEDAAKKFEEVMTSSFIAKPESERYQQNATLPREFLPVLMSILERGTLNTDKQLTMSRIVAELEKLCTMLMSHTQIKTSLLDLAVYKTAHPRKRLAIINEVKNSDRIVLTNTSDKPLSILQCVGMIQELQEAGLVTIETNRVLQGNEAAIRQQLKQEELAQQSTHMLTGLTRVSSANRS